MKDWSQKIRGLLFLFILFILIVPIIQNKFEFIKLKPLKGAIAIPVKNYFNVKDWFSGEYQSKQDKYLSETFGFRNIFVRFNNQMAFNLFRKARANGVIIGKNGYLFEQNYINAYNGTDFLGADSILHRMQRLKFIQDTLNKLNKTIFIVFAAGKGSYFAEYFPDKYKTKTGPTNYEYHIKIAQELGLNYIDFNKYFVDHKSSSKYQLYPKYGIHWSYYGMSLATDSILHYIEKIRNIDLNNIYWNELNTSSPNEIDYDIGNGMNLLCKLDREQLVYPKIQYENDSTKAKPSFLVISDSFFWEIFNSGISSVFSKTHFWFYNKQIYPDSYEKPLEASQVNLKEEIAKHDIIMIMGTEATLTNLGWGFIENVYQIFKEGDQKKVNK